MLVLPARLRIQRLRGPNTANRAPAARVNTTAHSVATTLRTNATTGQAHRGGPPGVSERPRSCVNRIMAANHEQPKIIPRRRANPQWAGPRRFVFVTHSVYYSGQRGVTMFASGTWRGFWEQSHLGRQEMHAFELHFRARPGPRPRRGPRRRVHHARQLRRRRHRAPHQAVSGQAPGRVRRHARRRGEFPRAPGRCGRGPAMRPSTPGRS